MEAKGRQALDLAHAGSDAKTISSIVDRPISTVYHVLMAEIA